MVEVLEMEIVCRVRRWSKNMCMNLEVILGVCSPLSVLVEGIALVLGICVPRETCVVRTHDGCAN